MKKPRTGIALLVVGVALADLGVAVFLDPVRGPSGPLLPSAVVAAEALAYSQVGLVAIWLVLGGSPDWVTWRLAATWPLVAFWCRLLSRTAPLDRWSALTAENAVMFLTQAAGVTVPLVVVRYLGVTVADLSGGASAVRPFQFSLRALMLLTTGLAVFLALLSYAVSFEIPRGWPLNRLVPLTAYGAGHATIALAAMWLVLGRQWFAARLSVFCLVLGSFWAVVAAAVWIAAPPNQSILALMGRFAVVLLLEALLLIGCLWAVRGSGFRLVTCPARHERRP